MRIEQFGSDQFRSLAKGQADLLPSFIEFVSYLASAPLEGRKSSEHWKPAVDLLKRLLQESSLSPEELLQIAQASKQIISGYKFRPLRSLAFKIYGGLKTASKDNLPVYLEAFAELLAQGTSMDEELFNRIKKAIDNDLDCFKILRAYDQCLRIIQVRYEPSNKDQDLILFCFERIENSSDVNLEDSLNGIKCAATIYSRKFLEERENKFVLSLLKLIQKEHLESIDDFIKFLEGTSKFNLNILLRELENGFEWFKSTLENGVKLLKESNSISLQDVSILFKSFKRFQEQRLFHPDRDLILRLEDHLLSHSPPSALHIESLYACSVIGLGGERLAEMITARNDWSFLKRLITVAEGAQALYHFGYTEQAKAFCELADTFSIECFTSHNDHSSMMLGRVASALNYQFGEEKTNYLEIMIWRERSKLLRQISSTESEVLRCFIKLGLPHNCEVIVGMFFFDFEVIFEGKKILIEIGSKDLHYPRGDKRLGRVTSDRMKMDLANRLGLRVLEIDSEEFIKTDPESRTEYLEWRLRDID